MRFQSYLAGLNNSMLAESVEKTANLAWTKIQEHFDYSNHINGLLLGNVQSGKTVQTLGIISKLADEDFRIFLLLTTDNVYLQKQTFERATNTLKDFDVIGEYDDVKFMSQGLLKPIVIVLKKNTNILRKWRNHLSSSGYCLAKPILIFDDEADAASLNTLINKKEVSTINNHLASIKKLSSSSIYFQITATPQAILLQSSVSNWNPAFVIYFPPGGGYIGGDFIYSAPVSYCIRFTGESELDDVRDDSIFIPLGLRNSLMSFLVVCGHFKETGQSTCSFLIHPSVRINDHEMFAKKIGEHLNYLLSEMDEDSFDSDLRKAWQHLQSTKPDITNYVDIKKNIATILYDQKLNVNVLNSSSPIDIDYNSGFNILVGGNSLGRGLTLPRLQTVYYCRKSKTPQADSFWQHSRMFGYDRDAGLMRIFIPPTLHKLFTDLNNSNRVLIKQIEEYGLDGIQLIYPENIRPTRKNVIDDEFLNCIVGGVNYFPNDPLQENTEAIDDLLSSYTDENGFVEVSFDVIYKLLGLTGSYNKIDWNNEKFKNCVQSLNVKRPSTKYLLIIRHNRDIAKGSGTMLSPNDRNLGDSVKDSVILTLYRNIASTNKGWKGNPFWMHNIKFPSGICFYDTKS
ncbi:MAG: Z1 domain-containing protein [Verrucomicrobia bacterium]|nr:Z1 domain-containing protein [Verrucomicrobiota bacterium]